MPTADDPNGACPDGVALHDLNIVDGVRQRRRTTVAFTLGQLPAAGGRSQVDGRTARPTPQA